MEVRSHQRDNTSCVENGSFTRLLIAFSLSIFLFVAVLLGLAVLRAEAVVADLDHEGPVGLFAPLGPPRIPAPAGEF